MDEFNKQPQEFATLGDEFNGGTVTKSTSRQKPSKRNRKARQAMIQFFTASVFTATVVTAVITPPSIASGQGSETDGNYTIEQDDSDGNYGDEHTPGSVSKPMDQTTSEITEETDASVESSEGAVTGTEEAGASIESSEEPVTGTEESTEETSLEEVETGVCDECGGTGIYCPGDPNFGYDRGNGHGYAGCNGTGYSPCPDIWCRDGVRVCEVCKGTGTDTGGENCPECKGSGNVVCEFCNGTGIAECICKDSHEICGKCGGTG